ncbi:MAG: hypothetical protein AVDCRST_MAG42-3218, partial [uncultured Chthoniobacterales bacterium]
ALSHTFAASSSGSRILRSRRCPPPRRDAARSLPASRDVVRRHRLRGSEGLVQLLRCAAGI